MPFLFQFLRENNEKLEGSEYWNNLLRVCILHWFGLDCAVFYVPAITQYRLYGRRILEVKRPNQQYQSTEGESWKQNNTKNKENRKYTHTQNSIQIQRTTITQQVP